MGLCTHSALANHWQWQANAGVLHQDYQEKDTTGMTTDGILNSETGNLPMVSLTVESVVTPQAVAVKQSWQPYGKLDVSHASGKTNYDGYLQSANILTPYQTSTDNNVIQANLALGATKAVTDTLAITPRLAISHHHWKRKLVQYTEDFGHTAVLAGASLYWQPSQSLPLSLQFTGEAGKIIHSSIDVPQLGLKQPIGKAAVQRVTVHGNYTLTKQLSLKAGMSRENWQYKESNIQNGYQYPSSKSKQTLWQLGLGYRF